ncbi:MAG: NADH-quinone oxidoreductase subunit C [Chloroflexi bacterium]|nr:NADH-quinone oxidoreductase subunit C [Chloroflexota bacterium]
MLALAEPITVRRLREQHPDTVLETVEFRGETTVRVPREQILAICQFLRDDPATDFNFLIDLTAVDMRPRTPRFDVVYHLYSLPRNHYVRLKAGVGEDEAIDSVISVWAAANWAERECYDMFGIPFAGHSDLRRILLPEYWDEGFPLRKDYPVRGIHQNKWDYAPERTTP